MIISVTSSLPDFKSVAFGAGLNILLADVTAHSTEKQTRNSAGKTSLVEIIHFLLGSDADKNSVFKKDAIINHTFSMGLSIKGRAVVATRSGSKEKFVYLSDSDAESLGLVLRREEGSADGFVAVDEWKAFLGEQWFGIPAVSESTPFADRFAPTFRSLIGYFGRRRKSGGYNTIEKQNEFQQPGDWQVNLSYLLGLDWEVAREFQEVRARKKLAATLKKAIQEGELGTIFGTTAEIRPELARTERRIDQLKVQIDHFQVHQSYRELGERAARLKDELSEITYALAESEEAIAYLNRSLEEEKPPAYAAVERLYQAAGIELPAVALRRFDEVKEFQASVTANRRSYLEEQVAEIAMRRDQQNDKLKTVGEERSSILRTLDGKGAFEDLVRLREDLGVLSSRAETLRSKLRHTAVFENNIAQLKLQTAELEIKLQNDHKRSEEQIRKAIVMVDRAIGALYDDRTGNLIIEASKNGPELKINIQGGGNQGGIDMMKIFCFDMMLLQMAADRFGGGPGFIIHDSHLFDGVDSRQVRGALIFGAGVANEVGGQYIVTMNSDEFEKTDPASVPVLRDAVLPVRLTDDETGGLFGFRFD